MSPTRKPASEASEEASTQPEPQVSTQSSSRGRQGVFVPAWLLGLVVLVLIAGLGFGVGRWTDDSDHGDRPAGRILDRIPDRILDRLPDLLPDNRVPGNRVPGNGGNQGGGNNGNGPFNPAPTQGVVLGVSVQDSSSPPGAQIANVANGSPAAQAGLKAGDVITAVDNDAVSSAAQLASRIQSHKSGDQVTITYSRSGASSTVQVKLATASTSSAPAA